jgi:RNA-binding protein Musashi
MTDYYGPVGGGGGGDVSSQVPDGGRSHQPQQQHHNPNQHHQKNNYQNKSVNNDQSKIFVGGLSWQTTEESLQFHFEQFGPVASVDVMRDRITGDPRGFAFVVFGDPSTIDLIMAEEKHEINHKVVDVKRAQARGKAPPSIHGGTAGGERDGNTLANNTSSNTTNDPSQSNPNHGNRQYNNPNQQNPNQQQQLSPEQLQNKVFVGGIPPHIDRDGLKEIFEEFGTVVDAIVMVDQVTNRSRCFGFVTFENGSNGAHKAIERQPLNIQGRNVEVKLATPKSEQRRMPTAAGPKHVGLRAGMSGASSSSGGKYAGFSVAYGRSGWKAGYGTFAFGQAGWGVKGWEDIGAISIPERVGFSFSMLEEGNENELLSQHPQKQRKEKFPPPSPQPPSKRARH